MTASYISTKLITRIAAHTIVGTFFLAAACGKEPPPEKKQDTINQEAHGNTNEEPDRPTPSSPKEKFCGPESTVDIPRFDSQRTIESEIKCPSSMKTAFVFDDDSNIRKQHPWDWLLRRPWNLDVACTDANSTTPLQGTMPTFCESIQEMAAIGKDEDLLPCVDKIAHPRTRKRMAHGEQVKFDRTPAVKTINEICRRISDSSLSFVVFAFDGVPDQTTGLKTPLLAFAESISECASDSICVDVVAVPQKFTYYYVLSAKEYTGYGRKAAESLKKQISQNVDHSLEPILLHLSPEDSLRPAARAQVAQVNFEKIYHSQRDESLKHYEDAGIHKIELQEWLE